MKMGEDYVVIGPYFCHVDTSVSVPEGEAGLFFIREFLKKNERPGVESISRASFTQGFVGFLSYDLGEEWMGICGAGKNTGVPKAHFVYVDAALKIPSDFFPLHFGGANDRRGNSAESNITRREYFEKLARIKEYLLAGETYQVNFSQKFCAQPSHPLDIFRFLSARNPSPHQFFMETKEWAVISNSPERLFSLEKSVGGKWEIFTQPIKGTVPRGADIEEDEVRIRELLASEKDRAELAMIVDLERNDVGKICAPGSVEVLEERAIEKYSHVIHTAAKIRGELEQGRDWLDALRALFPGGSITGAPKKRTMEIIAELEGGTCGASSNFGPPGENFGPPRGAGRGVYCGSAGWIDLSGACDFNILIRTLWYDKRTQKLEWRSGGGIVVDSDPAKEYEETLHKAAAIGEAVLVRNGIQ